MLEYKDRMSLTCCACKKSFKNQKTFMTHAKMHMSKPLKDPAALLKKGKELLSAASFMKGVVLLWNSAYSSYFLISRLLSDGMPF